MCFGKFAVAEVDFDLVDFGVDLGLTPVDSESVLAVVGPDLAGIEVAETMLVVVELAGTFVVV